MEQGCSAYAAFSRRGDFARDLPRHSIKSRVKVNNTLYPIVIRSVGVLHTSPEPEKLAIEFLDDADPEVVIDEATTLPAPRLRPRRNLLENNTQTGNYAEVDRNIKNLSRRRACDAGYPS